MTASAQPQQQRQVHIARQLTLKRDAQIARQLTLVESKTVADEERGGDQASHVATSGIRTNEDLSSCREAFRMIQECGTKADSLHRQHPACSAAEQRIEKCNEIGMIMDGVKSM